MPPFAPLAWPCPLSRALLPPGTLGRWGGSSGHQGARGLQDLARCPCRAGRPKRTPPAPFPGTLGPVLDTWVRPLWETASARFNPFPHPSPLRWGALTSHPRPPWLGHDLGETATLPVWPRRAPSTPTSSPLGLHGQGEGPGGGRGRNPLQPAGGRGVTGAGGGTALPAAAGMETESTGLLPPRALGRQLPPSIARGNSSVQSCPPSKGSPPQGPAPGAVGGQEPGAPCAPHRTPAPRLPGRGPLHPYVTPRPRPLPALTPPLTSPHLTCTTQPQVVPHRRRVRARTLEGAVPAARGPPSAAPGIGWQARPATPSQRGGSG